MLGKKHRLLRTVGGGFAAAILGAAWGFAADPWADRVVSYSSGSASSGFNQPGTSLGSPERFTGEGLFPSVVSIFSPAFGKDELVQIGAGGELVVAFDEPIVDDPGHRFGVDLLIFGNAGFVDGSFPNGVIPPGAPTFGVDMMRVAVSADGVHFIDLGTYAEGMFPTQGYLDVGPYSDGPGSIETDFTRSVNPTLTAASFAGNTFAQALALYDGSGGGTPVDIAASGLPQISFVRVTPMTPSMTIEIEAFASVPEPSTALGLVLLNSLVIGLRRRGMNSHRVERLRSYCGVSRDGCHIEPGERAQ